MENRLEVVKISKTFGTKEAVKEVDFIVEKGEFLAILGSSGCGKTTILRILIGLLKPDEGKILRDGIDITNLPSSQRGMGIVFQNYALFQNMTVLENVAYALKVKKDTKKVARERALDIIEQVGLLEYKDKRPGQLSGGQQQRVAIARTLIVRPDIILFDEPMSALDVATRLKLREDIKKIQRKFNTSMIYITHDQEEAFSMADRIMVMENGCIQQLDTPENIIAYPANDFVKEFVVDNLKLKILALSKFFEGVVGNE